MYNLIRSGEIQPSQNGTITFVGEDYGSGISFFLVNNRPGEGPVLHRHPYTETWIVRAGQARITADGQEMDVGPGDIIVVGANTPHKFKNTGDGRLVITCIHASPVMIQENLEAEAN